jgi:hypothetical protein
VLVASPASFAPSPAAIVQQDRAVAFRGVGTWVDIYDARLLAHPDVIVQRSVAAGVRTIYIETGNFRQGADVVNRTAILQVIRRAHASGIRVVGWYLPGLVRPKLDRRRLIAAARLGRGSVRFDAIAFDIEASNVKKVNLRNRRLIWLANQVRAAVGKRVPIGAIIPSPPGMRLVPHYWPRFPYGALAARFDAFLPMCYFTYRGTAPSFVRRYTSDCVQMIRDATGNPDVAVHVIGGIAGRAPAPAFDGFVAGAADAAPIGISFYSLDQTTPLEFRKLRLATTG